MPQALTFLPRGLLPRLERLQALRPYAVPLLRLCSSVLATDAEENAVVAIRITSELHKAFRPTLEQEAVPFLTHVGTLFSQFEVTCAYHFEGPGSAPPPASATDGAGGAGGASAGDGSAGGDDVPRPLVPALRSFRVVTDTPLIVMFIFQLYPRLMATHMPALLPTMVDAVALRGPEPEKLPLHLRGAYAELRAAQVKTVSFVTFLLRVLADALRPYAPRCAAAVVHLLLTCPDVVATRKELLVATRHMVSTEFRAAFAPHIDTLLSEQALLGGGRAAHEALRPLAFSLLVRARATQPCAPRSVAVTRHLLMAVACASADALPCRTPQAELVSCAEGGPQRNSAPLAAAALPSNAPLTLSQLSRVVTLFVRGLHDSSLPLAVQSICVRLLLTLVEGLYAPSRRGSADATIRAGVRALLGRILASFTTKLASVQHAVPGYLRAVRECASATAAASAAATAVTMAPTTAAAGEQTGRELAPASEPKQAGGVGGLFGTAGGRVGVLMSLTRPPPEPLRDAADAKALVKTLLLGMKSIVWSITHFDDASGGGVPPVAGSIAAQASGALSTSQVRAVARLFASVPACLRLFPDGAESAEAHDAFAAIFAVLEPRNLLDAVQLRFDDLFNAMLESTALIQVPHALLSSATVSVHAADALAVHLVEHRMGLLGSPASPAAGLVLKLWSLLLHAVTKFSDCEAVLRPHVPPLVQACLTALREAPDPTSYVRLLRYLFRALSHAKFDALYKEFIPLLPPVLDALAAVLAGPERPGLHDAAVELSLSLPARLATLLPHLPRLMAPLVTALRGGAGVPAVPPSLELQLLGLRKLEGWVDSLNPEYLEPCIVDCEPELLNALWALLRPPAGVAGGVFGGASGASSGPGTHALRALQLLGKLGGRARRVLRDPARLDWRPSPEHGLRLILTFPPATSFLIPLDRCVHLARGALAPPLPGTTQSSEVAAHRRAALAFVRAALVSLLNLVPPTAPAAADGPPPASLVSTLQETLQNGTSATVRVERASPSMDLGAKTKAACSAERLAARQLLAALLCADADPVLGQSSDGFTSAVARHAAALCVTDAATAPHVALPLNMLVGGTSRMGEGAVATGSQASPTRPTPLPLSPLRQLDPIVLIDGMLDALCEGTRSQVRTAVAALGTFVDSVLLLCAARMPAALKTAEDTLGAGGATEVAAATLGHQPPTAVAAAAAPSESDKEKAACDTAKVKLDKKGPVSTKGKRSAKRGAAAEAEQDPMQAAPIATAAPVDSVDGASAPFARTTEATDADMPSVSEPVTLAPTHSHDLPAFMDDVWGRVLHCCHGTSWGSQLGGVAAVAALLPRLPRCFVQVHAGTTARALLSTLRALPDHSVADAADCAAAFALLVAICAPRGTSSSYPAVSALASVAAAELTSLSTSPAARRACEDAFASLSAATDAPVAQLFAPHDTVLLAPLISRSLATRPLHAGVGVIAALTFALAQHPPLVPVNDTVLAMLEQF